MASELVIKKQFWPDVIVFSIFGLDLFASFPGASAVISKAIVLGAIVVSAIFMFIKTQKVQPGAIAQLLYIYLFFLTIRLVNDFLIEGQFFFLYKHWSTIAVFFSLTMVIPVWLFTTRKFEVNFEKVIQFTQLLSVVVLALSIKKILSGEIVAINGGRFEGEGMLDTIYLGHQGLTLLIISLYQFKRRLVINFFCVSVGLLTVFLAGSRGPMVALCICMVALLFINSKNYKTKVVSAILICMVLLFYVPILNSINDVFLDNGFHSFDRITRYLTGEMDGGSGRKDIYLDALNIINDNPIFGYHYLLDDGSYVHNIIIEQFMAVGYLGGLIFLIGIVSVIIIGYRRAVRINDEGYKIFYILLLQYVVFGMFSRTILALPQLWICVCIVIHYSYSRYLYT